MKRAAFLDRDGVVNASVFVDGVPTPPQSVGEVVILDGVVEAIALLKVHGFIPVVVTNQPDVARGTTSISQVEAINQKIREITNIEHFYTCFHDDIDGCKCRKPNPGLLFEATKDLGIDLSESCMIGDRWRDIAAGLKAGVTCYFIDYSYGERQPEQPFTQVSSLLEAVNLVIGDLNECNC